MTKKPSNETSTFDVNSFFADFTKPPSDSKALDEAPGRREASEDENTVTSKKPRISEASDEGDFTMSPTKFLLPESSPLNFGPINNPVSIIVLSSSSSRIDNQPCIKQRMINFFVKKPRKNDLSRNHSTGYVEGVLLANNDKIKLFDSSRQDFKLNFNSHNLCNIIANIEDCEKVLDFLIDQENIKKFTMIMSKLTNNDLAELLSRLHNQEDIEKRVEYLYKNFEDIGNLLKSKASKSAKDTLLRIIAKSPYDLEKTIEFIHASQLDLEQKIVTKFGEGGVEKSKSRLDSEKLFFWHLLSCCAPSENGSKAYDYGNLKDFINENFDLIFGFACLRNDKFNSNQKQNLNCKQIAFIISNFKNDEAKKILLILGDKLDDIAIESKGRQIYEKIFELRFSVFTEMLNSDDGDKKLAKLITISEAIDLNSVHKIGSNFYDRLLEVADDRSLDLKNPNFLAEVAVRFEHYGLPIKFSIKSTEEKPSADLAGASASLQGVLSLKKTDSMKLEL